MRPLARECFRAYRTGPIQQPEMNRQYVSDQALALNRARMTVAPETGDHFFAVPSESVIVAEVCRHDVAVHWEGGSTYVAVSGRPKTGRLSRRKVE